MKYLITILTILALGSIIYGFSVESAYSQKFIGFGTLGLFIIVFPLFSWYRWKDKNVQDYMLTKENLDKMRENQKRGKL
jgi:hypothetical protein|uniref:hypothetical protein n=1 Tax=Gelidibacter sp. TaxID=2018083 RepID=UPI004049B9C4